MRCAQAVRSGVSSAKNHYSSARCQDFLFRIHAISRAAAILLGQELHGEVNSFQFAARNFQISGNLGPSGEQNRIEFPAQVRCRKADADIHARLKFNPLLHKLLDPPVQKAFIQFEIRDSISKQAADAVGFFKNDNVMSGAIQLLG